MERIFEKLSRYFGNWRVGVLNPSGGRWDVTPSPGVIPYLKKRNAAGHHIFLKPVSEGAYLLIDDIPPEGLIAHQENGRWRKGRLVVETSPGNFQIWIRSARALSLSEKRFWLKIFHSDPGCDPNCRWGRCPGFRNRKPKYEKDGKYPLAKLIWIDFRHTAAVPVIKLPEAKEPRRLVNHRRERIMPNAISRSNYEKEDASATDFAYALALLRYGHDEDEIAGRLMEERADWRHHQGKKRQMAYIKRTIEKAKTVIMT